MTEISDVVYELARALIPEQYGTSMHWPYCRHHNCTGCLPPLPPLPPLLPPGPPPFDLSLFRQPGGDHG